MDGCGPSSGRWVWVCPVSTDCFPLSHSTSSHSSFLVLSGAEMSQAGMPPASVVRSRILMPLQNRSLRTLPSFNSRNLSIVAGSSGNR